MIALGYLFIRGGGPLSLDGFIKRRREWMRGVGPKGLMPRSYYP
jgi:hypothetical protein